VRRRIVCWTVALLALVYGAAMGLEVEWRVRKALERRRARMVQP